MLIKIDPILSPEVLHTLRAMGHGDKLILCDSNFPAYSMNSRVHRIDGVNASRAAEAIPVSYTHLTLPTKRIV